jgi:hypothetical protein
MVRLESVCEVSDWLEEVGCLGESLLGSLWLAGRDWRVAVGFKVVFDPAPREP